MNDLHRGDIYEAKIPTTLNYPATGSMPVMILQNDSGEIPCDVVTVALLKRHGLSCSRNHATLELASGIPKRLPKQFLTEHLGKLSKSRMCSYLDAIESTIGVQIPEVLEAP